MKTVILKEEYIKLGQALKAAGLVDSGVEAKIVITRGEVKVNGEVDERRGRKLYNGDMVEYRGESIQIKQ
jgi:ribosome-associated protein